MSKESPISLTPLCGLSTLGDPVGLEKLYLPL